MPDAARDERIKTLLALAEKSKQQGHAQDAFKRLTEAAHLDTANEQVRDALQRLQLPQLDNTLLHSLKRFEATGLDKDYDDLQKTLAQSGQLSDSDATQCLDIVLAHQHTEGKWAAIFATLLARYLEVRKSVVGRYKADLQALVDLILNADDRSSSMLFGIVLEAGIWASDQERDTVQQSIFSTLSTRLVTSPALNTQIALLLSRQLRARPDHVATEAKEEVYRAMFTLMDTRMTLQQQNSGYAGLTQLFKFSPDRSDAIFSKLITTYITSRQHDQLVVGLSTAARMFLTLSHICGKLFLTDGFVQQLSTLLDIPRISEVEDEDAGLLQRLTLDLLNAACVDKACRDAIKQSCSTQLSAIVKQDTILSAQSALVLVKLSGLDVDTSIVMKFIEMALKGTSDSQIALEGLAYASLNSAVKQKIISNAALLSLLVKCVREQKHTFSGLTILTNITAYRPAQSEEQKKMAQLKAYANQSKPAAEDPMESDTAVTARCKKVLDAGVVPALVADGKATGSAEETKLKLRILKSLAREAKHRTTMVREGVVRLLLTVHGRFSGTDPDSASAQRLAAHALAKVLISVNPEHVFSTALPASSAVAAILPLLEIDPNQDERDLLPTFEALLALTNLASSGDQSVCDLILRKGWTALEDQHLLSSNRLIQRASVELVCNLMLSPTGIAKFADGSDQAARRLHILLALADVDDLATRRAAGGALAMLTEWDSAVKAVLKIERGIAILLSMASDSSEEIRHRGNVCLINCCNIPDLGTQAVAKLKQLDATTSINKANAATKSPDLMAATADLLKHLT